MRKKWLCKNWHLKVQTLLVVSFLAFSGNRTVAEIVPDNTLGAEKSIVTPNLTIQGSEGADRIDGGVKRGSNLFHSFQDFSPEKAVYFNNPADVKNIFTRVTGNNVSNINSTLGVIRQGSLDTLGNANLFLINPNGIIFGENVRLDMGGSFVASTASSVVFSDGIKFSAKNSEASPLLTVDVQAPVGLQFEGMSGEIRVQGSQLEVQSGKTLALTGGEVKLEGGVLKAPGGGVYLGGLAGIGTVGLDINDNGLSLKFPEGVARSDISLTNQALVETSGIRSGAIQVEGKNVLLTDNSKMQSLNRGEEAGGNITVTASEDLKIRGTSNNNDTLIFTTTTGKGNGGDITVSAKNLIAENGGAISTLTNGEGQAGNLTVKASDSVELIGAAGTNRESGLFAGSVNAGDGGNLNIETSRLLVKDGAQVAADNFNREGQTGTGKPGNVTVNARNSVEVIGTAVEALGSDGRKQPSTIVAFTVNSKDAGNITINTKQFLVKDGASISTTTNGLGKAGILNITASDSMEVVGSSLEGKTSRVRNATLSLIGDDGKLFTAGDGNDLIVNAGRLVLQNGGRIDSRTNTTGKGGNITINVGSLEASGGGQIISTTNLSGQAGKITVNATDNVQFVGVDTDYTNKVAHLKSDGGNYDDTLVNEGSASGIVTKAKDNSTSRGGDIDITTPLLSLTDGAQLSASTSGQNEAGNIKIITSNSTHISGVNSITGLSSGLFTDTSTRGKGGNITVGTNSFSITDGSVLNTRTRANGEGGNITVNTKTFEALVGGQLITTTSGSQRAGDITVNATETMTLAGSDPNYANRLAQFGGNIVTNSDPASGLFANTDKNSTGGGGVIFLNSDQPLVSRLLTVKDGARISVNSQGSGVGGDIQASARRINLDNNGDITAATQSTNGGNITVNVLDLLLMRHQSNISASAGEGQAGGNGGNITINAPKGFVVAVPREDNDIKAQAFTDRGGNVSITSQRRFGLEFRKDDTPLSDITVSSRFGEDGTTQLNDLNIDPSRGLTQLPETPRTVELSEGCQVSDGKEAVQFFDIGRGGTPPRPDEPLNIDSSLLEWNQLDAEKSNSLSFTTITNITSNHENIRGKTFTPNWEIVKTNQLPTAITRMTPFCQSQ